MGRGTVKARLRAWRERVRKRLRGVPHLFAKVTIIYCIICATAASAYSLRAQARGMSMEGVLGIVLGFFGGELLLLCLKTILKKEYGYDEDPSDEQDV